MGTALIVIPTTYDDGLIQVTSWGPVPVAAGVREFQGLVGGYLESYDIPDGLTDGLTMMVNEDGKARGLAVNAVATRLWQHQYGTSDVIVGPAVVYAGETPDDDDDDDDAADAAMLLGLTDAQVDAVVTLVRACPRCLGPVPGAEHWELDNVPGAKTRIEGTYPDLCAHCGNLEGLEQREGNLLGTGHWLSRPQRGH